MTAIHEIPDAERRAEICAGVLRDLPDWFGIEAATQDYIEKAKSAPFFAAYGGDTAVAFIYLHVHNSYTVELYCMGVLARYHRSGIGRLLLSAAERYSREREFKFITVKTLADTHPDEGYKKTREFYLATGFVPLEVFPELWGEENPCLFLAKSL
ncbi:MAG: GNAT family N-acetyltransferase [Oscillospiraceae bacterium]|jgi:GNAT superfamily N-acetyltransferase|nr:GNAT family N-acetyltransferase [Oscillospiraceae bacterium]